jgi:copper chaperone CopZ
MKTERTHTYKLEGLYSPGCFISVESALNSLKGVTELRFDYDRRSVTVSYDLMQVTSRRIEEMLGLTGYPVTGTIWQKIQLSLIHYKEENTLDNLRARPADCCSNPRSITQR